MSFDTLAVCVACEVRPVVVARTAPSAMVAVGPSVRALSASALSLRALAEHRSQRSLRGMEDLEQLDPEFAVFAGILQNRSPEPEAGQRQPEPAQWQKGSKALMAFARSKLETVRVQARAEEALKNIANLQSRRLAVVTAISRD